LSNDLIVNVDAETSDAEKGLGKIGDVAKGLGVGLLAVGAAVGGVFVASLKVLTDAGNAMSKFQQQTGVTDAVTTQFGENIKNVYKQGLGESIGEVGEAMAIVKQQSNLLGVSAPKDIEGITKSAMVLKDAFEFDVNESVYAAGNMVKAFGITSEEAYDLIAKGAQLGLNKSDDLIDTLKEYSPNFKMIGFSATDMFQILKDGSEAGAFTIDVAANAIKELGIRTSTVSTTTSDAFTALGFNATKMYQNFAAGGETSKKSFYDIMTALNNIKDPILQNTVGVALFGTGFEDMGAKAILNLGKTGTAFNDVKGTIDTMNNIRLNSLTQELDNFKRSVEMDILLPLGESLVPTINNARGALGNLRTALELTGILKPTNKEVETFGNKVEAAASPGHVQSMDELTRSLEGTGKSTKDEALTQTLVGWIENIKKLGDTLETFVKLLDRIHLGDFLNGLNGVLDVFGQIWGTDTSKANPFESLNKSLPSFDTWSADVQTIPQLMTNFDQSATAYTFGKKTVDSYSSGANSGVPGVDSSFNIAANTTNNLNKSGQSYTFGKSNVDSFSSGVNSGTGGASNAANNVGNSTSSMNKSGSSYSWGQSTSQSYASGVNWGTGGAASAGGNIGNAVKNNSDISLWKQGQNIVQSLIDGMGSMLKWVGKKASEIAQAIKNHFPSSPAKEGPLKNFPQTGVTLMQQLMAGVAQQKSKVLDMVANVAQGITNNVAVTPALGSINSNITIPIFLDGKKITEVIAPQMTKMIRSQGGY
jgi:hypothetical protein